MNEVLSNAAMWAIIVGFVQPPILSLIIQTKWSTRWQSLTAFGASIVTGGGTAFLTGQFTGQSLVTSVLLVTVVSIASYKGFWKPTGASPAIEEMTSSKE